MSPRSRSIRFTPQARRDLHQILLYSRRTWGAQQKARYQAAIDHSLDLLVEYPMLGEACEDLFPGGRRHPVEQHIIFYRIQDGRIVVVGILHARQDTAG